MPHTNSLTHNIGRGGAYKGNNILGESDSKEDDGDGTDTEDRDCVSSGVQVANAVPRTLR